MQHDAEEGAIKKTYRRSHTSERKWVKV